MVHHRRLGFVSAYNERINGLWLGAGFIAAKGGCSL